MVRVMCPNCRNEQVVNDKINRCIICGQILLDNGKLKAKVIKKEKSEKEYSEQIEKEVKKKFLCENCGKREQETLIDEFHFVCKKCKWKMMDNRKRKS